MLRCLHAAKGNAKTFILAYVHMILDVASCCDLATRGSITSLHVWTRVLACRCKTLVCSNWLLHGAVAMNTAIGVLHAPTPAQGFPETVKSSHSLPSREGVNGTDPKTPGSGSPLAPGGLAATLRRSPSRETSPEASDERAKPGTVSIALRQLVRTLLLSSVAANLHVCL